MTSIRPIIRAALLSVALAQSVDPAHGAIRFTNVTEALSLDLGNGRVSWADLDGDGWTDLVAGGKIWRNLAGRSFEDVTDASGIGRTGGTCVIGDFNGDGQYDLYLTGYQGVLCLGLGDMKFRQGEVEANPFVVQAAAAADIDHDGWIDLYLANYEIWGKKKDFPDLILRNDRGRLVNRWTASREKQMRGRGVACCDFNADGWIDVYVSNYRLMPNFLWLNRGGWQLEDVARAYGCAGGERRGTVFKNSLGVEYYSSGHTIGSVWADFNNDGLFDLFVGNFSHPPVYQDRPLLLENGGPSVGYTFTNRSAAAGIPWQESYASPAAADVDNDGRVDLFFTTVYPGDTGRLFRNLGDWRFQDVTPVSSIDATRTYQNAFADYDNDGRVDIVTGGKLYRNLSDAGNWLLLRLVGHPPNTAAIGAVVTLADGEWKVVRQVEAGTGSGNQNDLRLHFGLGELAGPVTVEIRWPDGTSSCHETVLNCVVTLNQP